MFQDLTLATALFLLAASFFAGFIDSIAGGGGLIQLPALLIGLPKSETAEVLGTNKLSAVFGTTTAAALYRKQIKPDLGKFENLRHLPKRRVQIAAFAGVVIGFYDGIFGPGTGSFLMLILVASLGYAFITASAIAKVVNVATNVGAIMVFGINGAVLWQIGIILGVANISGAVLGARLAIKGGSTLVRKVFLLVTVALIVKVGIATF